MTRFLKGTDRPLAEAYQLALLDLDGVVYRGKNPVEYAADSIRAAEAAGMTIEYTTNNSSRFQHVVADQLKGNDIIKHKGLFKLFASLTGGKDKIAQGTYVVNSDMDYRALLNSMSSNSASRKEISVTITEGQTVKQIFELLEKALEDGRFLRLGKLVLAVPFKALLGLLFAQSGSGAFKLCENIILCALV